MSYVKRIDLNGYNFSLRQFDSLVSINTLSVKMCFYVCINKYTDVYLYLVCIYVYTKNKQIIYIFTDKYYF